MKKTGIVLIVLVIVLAAICSFVVPVSPRPLLKVVRDTLQSPLALYGKMVYEREKCGDCHSLDGKDKNLYSLDGAGRKYSLAWHYVHLEDPRMMVPGSDMPSFKKLTTAVTDPVRFAELWQAATGDTAATAAWENLQEEAAQIRQVLAVNEINSDKTLEMHALLAYLLSQPASPEKIRADSIYEVEKERRAKDWIAMAKNPMQEMVMTAKNKNPMNILSGRELFLANCFVCHGKKGEGIIGPNLTDNYWLHGSSPEALLITIGNGVPDHGMKSWREDFTPKQIGMLAAFVQSLQGTHPPNAKAPQGDKSN